ncbi:uncharacterized protein PG998_003355 [Apiospora kogelbergensis]|uniref:Uncharacterized protein n=1 Tax=Apiospora kogelbergensis TaxID=1337665 RepID=A0AAW0QL03_9PEZI
MQLRRSVSQTFGSAHPALLHTAVPPTATREDDEKRRQIWRGLGLGVNDSRSSSSHVGETGLLLQQQQQQIPSSATSTAASRAELQLRLQDQLQRLKQHTAAHNTQLGAAGNP